MAPATGLHRPPRTNYTGGRRPWQKAEARKWPARAPRKPHDLGEIDLLPPIFAASLRVGATMTD